MTRQKIVAGNWKMNGSLESIAELMADLARRIESNSAQVIVAPSLPYLAQVSELAKGTLFSLAAQNVSEQAAGAFTGEVSLSMLKDFSVEYVLVGHSERRALFGETDRVVAEKTKAILAAGLKPILCIGETLDQRQSGTTLAVCHAQVAAVLELVGIDAFENVIIAYEPVWAIGTGLSATAEQAQEVHFAIRQNLATLNSLVAEKVQILYGGSVKASNSSELFSMPDIDGALVGGASLLVDEFVGIVKATG